MNIKNSSSIRTKAIDKAIDFINGKKFGSIELDEMFDILMIFRMILLNFQIS